MENFKNINEQKKAVIDGGLQEKIIVFRDKINALNNMVDQIERLQRVPHGYKNLGEKVDSREIPALDQFTENRALYDNLEKNSEEALVNAYLKMLEQLSLLRDITGISSNDDALKFDPKTGRQEKDL